MRYQVPQYIGIEDKIFGPLTIKQFIYLAGGGGISFVAYKILPLFIAVFVILPVIVLSLTLAFYRINNKPFIFIMESAIKYFFSSKLYIWKKMEKEPKKIKKEEKDEALLHVPKLSDSKLKNLTWSLDIHESLNPVTKDDHNAVKEKLFEKEREKNLKPL